MRERTDEQRTTPKIRPTPGSTTQPSGVSPSDTPRGGANSECYARTTPSRRWGQNREEQWGQFRVLQPPTYFFAPPTTHELAVTLRALDVPEDWTHEILRRAYIAQLDQLARMSYESPDELHSFLIESMRPLLPEGVDVDKHFTPRYRPWQQRIAVVPDGDLFATMREAKASIVTDTIETFTEHGLKVGSGEEIPADIVVTATGFNLSVLGDVAFTVDAEPVDFTQRVTWRGIMISGLPNMAYVFGYFRHSWTLRVDLVADLVCRLLEHLQNKGAAMVVPRSDPRTWTWNCVRGPTRTTSTPAASCARNTCCSNRATASRGHTCSSTSRSGTSFPEPTSTTGRSCTAEPTPEKS
jgi:hypothetical protein